MGELLLRLFRLVNPRHGGSVEEAFGGWGGLYGDGRWHYRGALVVYAAASVSLALLETRVHWRPGDPARLNRFTGEVPEDVLITLLPGELPVDGRMDPPPASTRRLGTRWLQTKASVGLVVPSVIVPEERNCLLNPLHPAFRFAWFSGPEDYPIDARLMGSG